ncbi:hypothetical protein N7533_001808 [Penicillium manginii]|nr:uncharacterized protein N7533_001808 [Penicillium manginii]KAJ5763127.1 hypothetical protein N7533_001808 [Penicillium manginii]
MRGFWHLYHLPSCHLVLSSSPRGAGFSVIVRAWRLGPVC